MNNAPSISVVIPAYNEEASIGDCVQEVARVLNGMGKPFEIVVVDDGSRDGTFAALKREKEKLPELVIVRLETNSGQTAAFHAGFANARGDVIVTMDADLQNDPADIPKLLTLLSCWDVACGYRGKRMDSAVRRLSSRLANATRNTLTGDTIRDVGCSLRAMKADCVRGLRLYEGMHRFLPTLLRMDGWKVTETEVNHRPRSRGTSKYGVLNRLFKATRDLMAVRWMQARRMKYRVAERIA